MLISCTGDGVTDGRQIEIALLIPRSSGIFYSGQNTWHVNVPNAYLQDQRHPGSAQPRNTAQMLNHCSALRISLTFKGNLVSFNVFTVLINKSIEEIQLKFAVFYSFHILIYTKMFEWKRNSGTRLRSR